MSVIANLLGYDTVISKSQVLKAEVIAFVKTVSIDCFVFLLLLVDIVNLFRGSRDHKNRVAEASDFTNSNVLR